MRFLVYQGCRFVAAGRGKIFFLLLQERFRNRPQNRADLFASSGGEAILPMSVNPSSTSPAHRWRQGGLRDSSRAPSWRRSGGRLAAGVRCIVLHEDLTGGGSQIETDRRRP